MVRNVRATMLVLLVAEASVLTCVAAFQPHFPVLSGRPSPALRPHRAGYCCGAAPGGLQMASAGGGGSGGGSGVPPPETEAEKRELANLRQLAAQSQQAPDREQQAARSKVLALQKEFQAKVGVRKMVADKATELLGKAATDPRLASAASASATETVLAKNPQVAQLDADLLRISNEIKYLVPPGLCALEAPSKKYGYVRELNAMPAVLTLQRGNARAERISQIIIAADQELRFLSDRELNMIHSEIAAGDTLEAATLRRSAATILRDFKGTIVEGAQEALEKDMAAVLQPEGPLAQHHVAHAYWSELEHLLRLCHYATAAALVTFTDDQQIEMAQRALAKHKISTQVLNLSLLSMQKRANFLCKFSQAAPKCWVASHFAFLHLIERLA